MGLCADAVADVCYRLISDQNANSRLKTNTSQETKRGRRIPRFKDKDLLGDWNSHTLSVRMHNLYPGCRWSEYFLFPILPIGTNVSLYTRMCDLRFFIVGLMDAFTGLKVLHLPLHTTDSYQWAEGV
jgi:hypothetical protein